MTRLNYSNLSPEVQESIQKLIGCDHEELEGKQLKATDAKTIQTLRLLRLAKLNPSPSKS